MIRRISNKTGKINSSRHWVWATVLILFAFSAGVSFWPQDAHAVRISMKRIVFGDKKRSEVLTIINNTPVDTTYRLGWRKYRMDEKKSLVQIKDGEDASDILWAEDMVRYAPRRVKVPAGGSQQIRLMFRRPKDLQDGEYRAHLWIVTESQPEQFDATADGRENAVKLAVQPAISLPVFVRVGDLSAQAGLEDAKLVRAGETLNVSFRLTREGNRSLYGDLDFICQSGGADFVLRQVRGIAVYPEVSQRYFDFEIPLETAESKSCSNVEIIYKADPEDSGADSGILARAQASL